MFKAKATVTLIDRETKQETKTSGEAINDDFDACIDRACGEAKLQVHCREDAQSELKRVSIILVAAHPTGLSIMKPRATNEPDAEAS